MTDGHDHSHDHHHPQAHNRRRLVVVMALTVTYMLAEAVGGFLTNSLALLSDAGHMLADVASLGLAWLALRFAARPITTKKTYGYYRIEILAALANGVTLVAISLLIAYEAIHRLRQPEPVAGFEMLLIAAGGLLVNAFSALLLHGASRENLNMRGAFLHITGDALGSVGAIIAGLLIWRWGWTLADPIISFVVCGLIVFSSWHLIHESVNILLEGTPPHISINSVVEAMHAVKGVADVHELHVWAISSGKEALSAHVTLDPGAAHRATLEALQEALRERFNITHVTIQIELPDEDEAASSRLYQIVRKAQHD